MADVEKLREALKGDVLVDGDREYDRARLCFNLLIVRKPAAIARCVDAEDVATALAFGQEQGLEIAVRGGGHNPAGHCSVEDGLVIDLSRMRNVEVDPDARIARSGGGATWLDFDAAAQQHGLATPGGVVGSTGVTGLTLGGGIGHLTAQFGLTCDGLAGAELVTPAGEKVRASEEDDAELLWGLRGGGGNFGVVTQLVPDADGQPKLVTVPCYTGDGDATEALAGLRSAPGLVNDGVRRHGFLDQQRVFDPGYGVDRNYWKGHFVRELPDELIQILVGAMTSMGRPPGGILIESLHGAPKDVDPGTAALGYRDAAFNISVMASWEDPALDDDHIAWSRETAAAIEPWATSGGYANYMQADEPLERVRAAFGAENFTRLQALKSRYDPDNLLRRNQNIPPG
jgi:FAD/FMN-containing dehydrogenase